MSPLFEIEDDIASIRTAARLLGRLACSTRMGEICSEELEAIRGMIDNQIDNIDCRWRGAGRGGNHEEGARRGAGRRKGGEGGARWPPEDVQYVRALRAMLRTAAAIALRECDKGEATSSPKRRARSRRAAPMAKRRKLATSQFERP
jgi:hypothetical protein